MTPAQTPLLVAVAAALLLAAPARAQQPAARTLEPPADFDASIKQEEIGASLAEVARTFGPDAVILQTALLNEAVRNGSILEARVDAPTYQQRDGKRYVAFVLESGIVYNDTSVTEEERVQRTWREIVAAALHRLTELHFKTEGVAVSVGYHHRVYEDERHLRDELPEKRGEPETTSYFIALEDAAHLARGTANAEDILPRVAIVRGAAAAPAK